MSTATHMPLVIEVLLTIATTLVVFSSLVNLIRAIVTRQPCRAATWAAATILFAIAAVATYFHAAWDTFDGLDLWVAGAAVLGTFFGTFFAVSALPGSRRCL